MSPPEYAIGTRLTVRFLPWNYTYAPPRLMDVKKSPDWGNDEPLEFELEVCGEGSRFGLSATFKVQCSPDATPLQQALLRLICLPGVSESRGFMIKVYDQRIMPGPFGRSLDRQCEERFVNEALIYSEFSTMLYDDDPKAPQVPFFYGSFEFNTPEGLVKGLLLENIPHLTLREYVETAATCACTQFHVLDAFEKALDVLKPVTALGFINPCVGPDNSVLEYDPAAKTKAEQDPEKLFKSLTRTRKPAWLTSEPEPRRVELTRCVMVDFAQFRRRFLDETDLEWTNFCDGGNANLCKEELIKLGDEVYNRPVKSCAWHDQACRTWFHVNDPRWSIDDNLLAGRPFRKIVNFRPVLTKEQAKLKKQHRGRWGAYAYRPYELDSPWRYRWRVFIEAILAWYQQRPSVFAPDETDLEYKPIRLDLPQYKLLSEDEVVEANCGPIGIFMLCFLLWFLDVPI